MTPRAAAILKVVVAFAAIVALVAIPARELAPGISVAELALCVVAGFGGLMVLSVCSLQLAQFILRKGGTDSQWFWFSAEPPGLVQQRKEAKRAVREP